MVLGSQIDIDKEPHEVEVDLDAPESIALSHHILEDEIATEVEECDLPPKVLVTWEPQVAEIVKILMTSKKNVSKYEHRPFMIGIVGIPGSGKTTSCSMVKDLLDKSVIIPMDGYHLPISELQNFPDPKDAIYRRGAPHTFNPSKLQSDLDLVMDENVDEVRFPGFDHDKGDPEPNAHTFRRGEHEVVICEGIYLLHDDNGWENIKNYFDWTIYIHADIDVCVERLKIRNKCIPGYTPEEIDIRCDEVDRVNAETVERSRRFAHYVVSSSF